MFTGGDEKLIDSEDEVVACIGERKLSGGVARGRWSGDKEYGLISRMLDETFIPTKKSKI